MQFGKSRQESPKKEGEIQHIGTATENRRLEIEEEIADFRLRNLKEMDSSCTCSIQLGKKDLI